MKSFSPGILCKALCSVIFLMAAVCLCSCAKEDAATPAPKHNLLLISIDTLRADRLNCYGYEKRAQSPNIDALAADGILFENHISASPWTTPSHMSILTSLYPSEHGVTTSFGEQRAALASGGFFEGLPASRTTLAETLKQAGYETGAFTGGGSMDPKIGFEQGFDTYTTTMFKVSEANMQEMGDWLDQRRADRFFLFWHNFEVHVPFLQPRFLPEVLPEEKAQLLTKELQKLAAVATDPSRQPDGGKYGIVKLLREHDVYTLDVCEALYGGGVVSADQWLGRFMQKLKSDGLYDDLLIVFTSDHGGELADHVPSRIHGLHGHTLYEELIRVPFIIKLPGQQHAATRISAVSRAVDVMPTILDVLSVQRKEGEMQGVSLRSMWEAPDVPTQYIAYSEALAGAYEMKSLRTDRYKFIVSMDPETVLLKGRRYIPDTPTDRELFDLQEDPRERENLLKSDRADEFADLSGTLESSLRKFVSEQSGQAEQIKLDDSTLDALRTLGYIN